MGFLSSLDKALFGGPGEVGGLIGGPSIRAMEAVGDVAKTVITSTLDTTVDAVDYCKENPVEATLIATAAVATGTLASMAATAAAPSIATTLGSSGVLSKTAGGTVINTLSGAAKTSASLAKLGGGSLASGGLGMAGGTKAIGTTAAISTSAATAVAGKNLVD